MSCSCNVVSQNGNFFNVNCQGPNGNRFYSIQASNQYEALVKAKQMCTDEVHITRRIGVKLISKKPAGGAGNFIYTFLCTCDNGDKKNVSVTSANDTEAEMLALQECSLNCGDNKSILVESLEIPVKELNSEIEKIENFKNEPLTNGRTYINYSFYDQVYQSGDRLYGNWTQSLSGVCSGNTVNGFFYNIQILKSPEIVGNCSGRYVVKIETTD